MMSKQRSLTGAQADKELIKVQKTQENHQARAELAVALLPQHEELNDLAETGVKSLGISTVDRQAHTNTGRENDRGLTKNTRKGETEGEEGSATGPLQG